MTRPLSQMAYVYLVTELCCLTAASLSFIFNAYIIYCFWRKKIPSPENLRLALYLAIGDLGYAVAALVHVGYLAIYWSNVSLDYNPYYIIFTNSFLPAKYKKFLLYVSYSNTIAGFLIVIMSMFVFAGIRKISARKIGATTSSSKSSSVFRQANRITVGILFCSLFFVTIPSLLVTGYEEVTGVSLFAELGPFYICAILVNGFADGLVFVIINRKQIGSTNRTLSSTGARNTIAPMLRSSLGGHRGSMVLPPIRASISQRYEQF
ncbi:G_PROTEIN_RECEP_F1_2 domain-containing protein [Caenorhabditis elegans]|uniref:G_PROTEIN_RECEP_F1_2 domain-containing protein n=1 Tax=Caenorhabditis elegans TaxID=6239 RepID=A0A7R9SUZ9_CAEEL|nr:G_PROTEIN_RECEP_F1_2 domain-containing protein [Caenorhabditis elegans]CAD8118916.1 G_PROTEIN_RECEP_F1_2 domain-containing protein [Caenorhabditis elegans]